MSRVVIVVVVLVLKVKKRSGRTKTNPQADLRKEVAAEPAEVQCCASFCQGPGSPRHHVRTNPGCAEDGLLEHTHPEFAATQRFLWEFVTRQVRRNSGRAGLFLSGRAL